MSGRKGMALYLVLGLALVLFGLGAMLSMRSTFNLSAQRRVRQSLESRYLAEAGLQRALHQLKHGQTALSDAFDYGGGKVSLQFQPGTGAFGEPVIDVLTRGSFHELRTTLFAKVEVDPSFLKSAAGEDPPPDASAPATPESTPPAPSPASGHVALVKTVMTLPDTAGGASPDLPAAQQAFTQSVRAANTRYVESLASVSRAELRWNLFKLACAVAAAGGSSDPGPNAPDP
ncbi:MAG: hypothetical protein HYY25_15565 [Candidatus Wallbacteria bacterium]|nr:hypothetical protein [Candidatus Wallbacteria bacterium]